jgi:hypothetical protein
MNTNLIFRSVLCAAILVTAVFAIPAVAQNDSWIDSSGKWETSNDWSFAIPPSVSFTSILITNATTKTVTIDATTSGSFPSTMNIANLVVSGPLFTVNTLFLNNAGLVTPLNILGQLTMGGGGVLSITNSILQVSSPPIVDNGAILLDTGSIIATNSTGILIGDSGSGTFTVSNGTVLAGLVQLGLTANDHGTLTIAGGQFTSITNVDVGSAAGASGALWMNGGQLTVTNASSSANFALNIGASGAGRFILSNGTVNAINLNVGANSGSSGTLTLAGGTLNLSSGTFAGDLGIGFGFGSTGTVWMTGPSAVLNGQGNPMEVGFDGAGFMVVSNGLMENLELTVGYGSAGTLTLAGGAIVGSSVAVGVDANGAMTISGGAISNSSLFVGSSGFVGVAGPTGTVTMTGGTLSLSLLSLGPNGAGTMTISGGNVSVNQLAVSGNVTNSFGSLTQSGGTITIGSGGLIIGINNDSTGIVTITKGTFIDNTGTTTIGGLGSSGQGIGEFSVSKGTVMLGTVSIGTGSTLTMSGGGVVVSNLAGSVGSTFGMNGGSLEIQGNFLDSGSAQFNAGFVTVDATGLLRLGSDVTTIGSAVTNAGILSALAPNVAFNNALENFGNFNVNPSQFVIVPANMGNYGQITIGVGGLLSIGGFTGSEQTGNIFLNGGGILTVGSFWVNAGAIEFSQGGQLAGAGMYNQSLLEGSGVINVPVENGSGGTIRAANGLLVLQNANVLNDPGAFLEATVGGTLRFTASLLNQGVINPQGGVIDFQTNTLTNQGTMTGFGSYLAGQIINQGSANFQGGPLNVEATYINGVGYTTEVSYATASFFGPVTNRVNAVFKNTSSQITFYSVFYNDGTYISDPATNVFTATVALGPNGALVGGKGDLFVLQGDLTSANVDGLQIDGATLEFTAGAHNFTLAGTAHLGALQLDSGATLTLAGANLYVGSFDAIPSQITSADTIYYDPTQNPSLGGQTFALAGGGLVEAVPEPGTFALVLTALVSGIVVRRRRRA